MKLPFSTDDTQVLSGYAQTLLSEIYREGLSYQRGGVLLMDLEPYRNAQYEIFEDKVRSERSDKLMKTLDVVNQQMGRGTLRLGREGFEKDGWRMRQNLKSPNYTTQADELMKIQ
jgi:DNA polymerase V